jgi:periodic tryptophan protein 1
MITATTWVPRGYAAAFPSKYGVDEEELARISKLAKLKLDDAKEDLEIAKNGRPGEETSEDDSGQEESGVKVPQSTEYSCTTQSEKFQL